MSDLDLDAYLERIGWVGPMFVNQATLAELVERHMRAIPFDNLDVLLGVGTKLDLAWLQDKLIRRKRGGYCYEHCTLFAAVLEKLGFRVARHSARVIMRTPRTESPRTHMFLTVRFTGRVSMVDPGFGGGAALHPVPVDGIAGEFSFREDTGGYWTLRKGDKAQWVSTLEGDNPVDFVMANHFTSTHPSSPFTQRLLMQAHTKTGRVTVTNREVTVWEGEGAGPARELRDRAALRALVAEYFGADLPEIERIHVPSIGEW